MDGLFHRDKRARPPARRLWIEAVAAVTPVPQRVILAAARRAPAGDGHPVLLVPGFLRGEGYMEPLRRFLAALGYPVYGWRLGINLGPTERVLDGLERRLDEIARHHRWPASLIGHSLGGTLVRELAKARPHLVRQVIVLASPVRLPTASRLEPLYRVLARLHSPDSAELYTRINEPPSVPVTALHTRSDGIVDWRSCLEAEGPQRENVEITGPHSTMARNPAAWHVIADRLAQKAGTWRPFAG